MYVKAQKERFLQWAHVVVITSNSILKIHVVKKLHQKACRRIIFPSFNQSYHLASENTKRQYSRVYKKLTRRYIGVAVGS